MCSLLLQLGNSEAALDWVVVKTNGCSSLKVVKKTRESWDRKIILFFLADIGYEVGLRNVWCFRTWHTRGGGEIEGGQRSVRQGKRNLRRKK
jgi:hypothetical protein